MINSLTSHITTKTGETERSPLLEQLARRADVNRDGTVTNAEFGTFLSGLMQSLEQARPEAAASPAPSLPAPPATEGVAPQDVLPAVAAAALRAAIARVAKER